MNLFARKEYRHRPRERTGGKRVGSIERVALTNVRYHV